MALGGRPADILWLVARQALVLTGAGLAAGLAGSFLLTRLLQGMLYGVGPRDAATLFAAAGALALAGAAATLLPAWRAVRVDPLAALRAE
jgi:ABC-type antimicrobial peptide transport system permease subunit